MITPSIYIQDKNFMAAYQEAFERNKANPEKEETAQSVINRILEDHFKKVKNP